MKILMKEARHMKQHYVMPVGVDDFKKVREEYYYVDKTDFIRTLIDGHSQVTLITRPRRFGKTLALSMLYYFFDINRAQENRPLFDGCRIEQAGDKYMKEQGSKPVIFLTLKDVKQPDFPEMLEILRFTMQSAYNAHKYLLQSNLLEDYEKDYFLTILTRKATKADLQVSLKNLTDYLHRYHQKTALLLLDEYDAPIQAAWDNGYYKETIDFMRNFLSTVLKSNLDLDFAVITGVLRIAKESIFSSLNNLEVASVLSGRYNSAIGFTYEEIAQMASDFNCKNKLSEIKAWYDGYTFSGQEIYNPWSVINYFLHHFRPNLYWLNTSGNSIIKSLLKKTTLKQEKELKSLLQGAEVRAKIDEGIIYSDIYKDRDALYTMLLTTGYLTLADEPTMRGIFLSAKLRIPNKEIRSVYAKEIIARIEAMEGSPQLLELLDDLLDGNVEGFSSGLNTYLETLASYYDTTNTENFYHGFMLGLLALLVPDYTVRSNRESGYGRFDAAIFPNKEHTNGVIMEFKVAESEAKLPSKADEALAQIETMDYLAEFRQQNITTVWQYGISFCGKKCHIAAKI